MNFTIDKNVVTLIVPANSVYNIVLTSYAGWAQRVQVAIAGGAPTTYESKPGTYPSGGVMGNTTVARNAAEQRVTLTFSYNSGDGKWTASNLVTAAEGSKSGINSAFFGGRDGGTATQLPAFPNAGAFVYAVDNAPR